MRSIPFFRAIFLLLPLIGTSRALVLLPNSSSSSVDGTTTAEDDLLSTQDVSGDTECAAASAATSFFLSFVSYGNYTALPGDGDDSGGLVPPQVVSMSFAVANEANGVYTICAFPLGYLSGGNPGTWIDDPSWQACADRRVRSLFLSFSFNFFTP